MLKERREIVAHVQGHLHDSEMAVEATMTAIGRLVAALPLARESAGISPVAGQPAFDSIAAAMAGIVQVRGHMIAAHQHLEATRAAFRLPIIDTGAGYVKPAAGQPRAFVELVPDSAAA